MHGASSWAARLPTMRWGSNGWSWSGEVTASTVDRRHLTFLGRSRAFEDPHDAVRSVDLDEVSGLDHRGGAHGTDDGGDSEIARNGNRVAEPAAQFCDDRDRVGERRHPSRNGD